MKKSANCFIFLSIIIVLFAYSRTAEAATFVSSDISTSTEWTQSGSPYVIDNPILVSAGTTLTIDQGVIVKFKAGLQINGTLDIEGNPQNKVHLTSSADDSVGGDIDQDGGSQPQPSDPWGITAIGSIVDIKETVVDYTGQGLTFINSTSTISGLELNDAQNGITLISGTLTLASSSVSSIAGNAVAVFNHATASFSDVDINAVTRGSAILVYNQSTATCLRCHISSITSPSDASDVYNGSGVAISDSTFDHITANSALSVYDTSGGRSSLKVDDSTFDTGTGNAIEAFGSSDLMVGSSSLSHFAKNGIQAFGNVSLDVASSTLSGNDIGLELLSAVAGSISSSTIMGNHSFGIFSTQTASFDASNNWWGTSTGPFNPVSNPVGAGDGVSGAIVFSPWITLDPVQPAKTPCCSNIIFLPGVETSRLYEKTGILNLNTQLWEPPALKGVLGIGGIKKLFLDKSGSSTQLVFTDDVISRTDYPTDNLINVDIYRTFFNSLDALVAGKSINSWEPFPYDWRLDVRDIVKNGSLLTNGSKLSLIAEVKRMAQSSKTGKVSLVAHSNGGLLAKALVQELQNEHLDDLIDKVIMVAVPQEGAPMAIAADLHGYDQALGAGWILKASDARQLAENMPDSYSLLPSLSYFSSPSPVVSFDPSIDSISNLRKVYGSTVSTYQAMVSFLDAAKDHRSKPSTSDLTDPNVLNAALLSKASDLHTAIDPYVFPSSMKVYQVVGEGLSTLQGIMYKKISEQSCALLIICSSTDVLDYQPVFTREGDDTVTSRSATAMNAPTYFIDLAKYNTSSGQNRGHSDILESIPAQQLIYSLIKNSNSLPGFVSTNNSSQDSYVEVGVHSPVQIDLYDSLGRHTGPIDQNNATDSELQVFDEQIPNSYYIPFGEGVYAGGDAASTTVQLTGLGTGVFTLDVSLDNGGVVATTTFADIPVLPATEATLTVAAQNQGQNPIGTLKVDLDGDGKEDLTIKPNEDFDASEYLTSIRQIISDLKMKQSLKDNLLKRLDHIMLLVKSGKIKRVEYLIRLYLKTIESKSGHKKISEEDAGSLIDLFTNLITSLESNS
jgi:hypothetical protein